MTVPHRDDVAGLATLRPGHNNQASVEMAGGNKTGLTIIETLVNHGRRQPGKYLASPGEIEAAMPQGEIALRRIKGDTHQLIVPPIIVKQRGKQHGLPGHPRSSRDSRPAMRIRMVRPQAAMVYS